MKRIINNNNMMIIKDSINHQENKYIINNKFINNNHPINIKKYSILMKISTKDTFKKLIKYLNI